MTGVVLIISAYGLLVSGRITSDTRNYSIMNAAGAGLIIVSLMNDFNVSALVIEVFWLLISIYGLWKNTGKKGENKKRPA